MPDWPRVSVIVPAHNYARYLPDALDSVLAQTFTAWECIVVDDGSTDETAAVCARYTARDERFRSVHQANQGLSSARNTGLREARGAYIQFLDADDRLAPAKLEQHAAFLDAHPETDVVYSEVAFFRDDDSSRLMPSIGGKLSRSIMARVHGNTEALTKLEHFNIMPVLAALVRGDAVARAGMFDPEARACEDWGFWIRCAVAGCGFDFLDTPEALAAVRAHGTSMSRDHDRMIDGLLAIARAFPASDAARLWPHRERLPLAYELAAGIDAVQRGAHVEGARRIWRTAGTATESLTAMRWRVYALAALLPRSVFRRIVRTPISEAPFELYRRLRSFFRR
jgi:glycosyltransferase involved in cell wall biosynthesis